jgi:sulfide dehydrogenase [flavocytochrome c] flavoprotein subunit
MAGPQISRREVIAGLGAMVLAVPSAAAQTTARVVVIGGGFGGATAAREVKRLLPSSDVVLVTNERTFTACPFSNLVLVGMREIAAQQFGYGGVEKSGVKVAYSAATAVDARAKAVTLADGTRLQYDRAIVSPGIDIRWDGLEGYSEAAADRMPHAWKAGAQTLMLRRQLEAMEDGGLVVMSVPANPFRCPPGPYERASLIAHYLKTKKPRSKLLVLDAKDQFSKQRLFQAAWHQLYPDHLEWVALSKGGKVLSVEPDTLTLVTEFGRHKATVANVIPPQKAAAITAAAGIADATGWCPMDPATFESRLVPNIHVLGDASIAGAMPKSAFSANMQAKVCATAVASMLSGMAPPEPKLVNTCYSLVGPDYGISVAGVYHPAGGVLAEIKGAGGVSRMDAAADVRAAEALYADSWFKTVTHEVFG